MPKKQAAPAPNVRLDGAAAPEELEEPEAPDLQQLVGQQDKQGAQIVLLQEGITEIRKLMQQLLDKFSESSASSPAVAALPAPAPPRDLDRENSLRVRDYGPDQDDDHSHYKMDKLPNIDAMLFAHRNNVGLTTALQKHYNEIHKELPAVLAAPIKRRHPDARTLLDMSFRNLKLTIFAEAARLEFGADLVSYLAANPQQPGQPVADYQEFLEGMLEAFPNNMDSMSVIAATLRAHLPELRDAYLTRHPPPQDERHPRMTVQLIMTRMADMERSQQFNPLGRLVSEDRPAGRSW